METKNKTQQILVEFLGMDDKLKEIVAQEQSRKEQ